MQFSSNTILTGMQKLIKNEFFKIRIKPAYGVQDPHEIGQERVLKSFIIFYQMS